MTKPASPYVLSVPDDPEKALTKVVLDELNRMNDRIRALEQENVTLHERVNLLYGALSAAGKPPQ